MAQMWPSQDPAKFPKKKWPRYGPDVAQRLGQQKPRPGPAQTQQKQWPRRPSPSRIFQFADPWTQQALILTFSRLYREINWVIEIQLTNSPIILCAESDCRSQGFCEKV
jgi:hypothetical protein